MAASKVICQVIANAAMAKSYLFLKSLHRKMDGEEWAKLRDTDIEQSQTIKINAVMMPSFPLTQTSSPSHSHLIRWALAVNLQLLSSCIPLYYITQIYVG